MAEQNLLIVNACLITGRGPVFPDGFVHISGSRIAALGPMSRCPKHGAMQVIDAHDRFVLPGFINPHMHLYGALACGMELPRMRHFGKVLKDLWWRLDAALELEDIFVSAMLGGVAAIRAGVTTLIDHHASYGAISGSLGAISEALGELGLRANLCFEISDRAGKGSRDEALAETGLWLESVRNWLAEEPQFLQRGMVGLHASMTVSDATCDAARELMDLFDVGAHVHVAEAMEDVAATKKKYRQRPVARLFKQGLLRPESIAVHCVHVDANDIRLLAKSAATVVHNPLSNLNNAVGVAPVPEMMQRKIPIVIGTDGMSAGVQDDLRVASVLHRPGAKDAQAGWSEVGHALFENAPSLVSRQFGFEVGTLGKNAAADLIIADARPATPVTKANVLAHVLFRVMTAPVRTTIVAGRVLMQDFEIPGLDEERLARDAQRCAKKLWKRMKMVR